ncbi:metal-dependent hydrolase [Bacillus sp. F19]|nr:metal-dependent hydrolase [Bacillus sp. F19]
MMYKTHLASSIAAGAGIAQILSIPFTIGFLGGLSLGSLLPDIDEPNSYIGRRSFGLSYLVKKKYGHRGMTHSLLAFCFFLYLVVFFPTYFTMGLCLGYLFHIIGDFFSKTGVPLFYPFDISRKKSPLTYKTSSFTETVILFISILTAAALILNKKMLSPLFYSTGELISNILLALLKVTSLIN